MPSNEEKINEFLKSVGSQAQLAQTAGMALPNMQAIVAHMGVNFGVILDQNTFIICQSGIAYLPRANIAPLYRRLLALNLVMGGPYFGLVEQTNVISLQITRNVEGLDFVEFKWMLDQWAGIYWRYVPTLIQEFQLPLQPS